MIIKGSHWQRVTSICLQIGGGLEAVGGWRRKLPRTRRERARGVNGVAAYRLCVARSAREQQWECLSEETARAGSRHARGGKWLGACRRSVQRAVGVLWRAPADRKRGGSHDKAAQALRAPELHDEAEKGRFASATFARERGPHAPDIS
jgi:hypothetical protein